MTDAQDSRRPVATLLPRASRVTFLWLAMLALTAFILAGGRGVSHAADKSKVDILYLSVTSEGSTAKAWYDGGPSPGVPVQEALTKFAHEGYVVAEVTQRLRTEEDGASWVVLLQRLR
jgi:hypothetical protein